MSIIHKMKCFSIDRIVVTRLLFGFGLSLFPIVEFAHADTTDQLLEELKRKGILTASEFKKLKARHENEVEAQRARIKNTKHANLGSPDQKVNIASPDDRYVKAAKKGLGVRIGDVDVSLSGAVTFFASQVFNPAHGPQVDGALMTTGANNSFAIRGGVPPSLLLLSLSTNQMGYDLGFTLGLYTGGSNINTGFLNANSGGAAVALGTPGIDARQVYGTIGTTEFGTVKIGRDVGLFASDSLFNDDAIFGAGVPFFNAAPHNSTLAHIGYGYLYADYIPQISYTSPNFNGVTFSIGAFTPLQEFNFSGDSGTMTAHDQPMIQGRLKYTGVLTDGVGLSLWTSALTQQHRAEVGDAVNLAPGTNIRTYGVDGGIKLDIAPVSFLVSAYYGNGLGTSALFYDGITVNGVKRQSYGGYAQGSVRISDRFRVGASWGISLLDSVYGDPVTLVRSSDAYMGFARYKLTEWMSLEAEYIHTTQKNQTGDGYSNNAMIVGSVFAF